jgi:hypothetical protein
LAVPYHLRSAGKSDFNTRGLGSLGLTWPAIGGRSGGFPNSIAFPLASSRIREIAISFRGILSPDGVRGDQAFWAILGDGWMNALRIFKERLG